MDVTPSPELAAILDYMPEPVVDGIESYAAAYGLSVPQAIEFAFASFLNVDATSFGEIQNPTPGQLNEEVSILKLQLASVRDALSKAGIPDPSIPPELPEA